MAAFKRALQTLFHGTIPAVILMQYDTLSNNCTPNEFVLPQLWHDYRHCGPRYHREACKTLLSRLPTSLLIPCLLAYSPIPTTSTPCQGSCDKVPVLPVQSLEGWDPKTKLTGASQVTLSEAEVRGLRRDMQEQENLIQGYQVLPFVTCPPTPFPCPLFHCGITILIHFISQSLHCAA